MRWLVLAIAISAGCYAPQLQPCAVTCGSNSPCPDDLTCGDDHFCHADGETACPATLNVTTEGDGVGRVTSVPAGVDCTSDSTEGCTGISFATGTSITLTETHSSDYMFSHWGGDACSGSSDSTCTFTLAMPMTVSATFH